MKPTLSPFDANQSLLVTRLLPIQSSSQATSDKYSILPMSSQLALSLKQSKIHSPSCRCQSGHQQSPIYKLSRPQEKDTQTNFGPTIQSQHFSSHCKSLATSTKLNQARKGTRAKLFHKCNEPHGLVCSILNPMAISRHKQNQKCHSSNIHSSPKDIKHY